MRPVWILDVPVGFVIDNAGVFDVLWYTFFTFGFKWVLLAIRSLFCVGSAAEISGSGVYFAAAYLLLPL
jgi:hypothetical protein